MQSSLLPLRIVVVSSSLLIIIYISYINISSRFESRALSLSLSADTIISWLVPRRKFPLLLDGVARWPGIGVFYVANGLNSRTDFGKQKYMPCCTNQNVSIYVYISVYSCILCEQMRSVILGKRAFANHCTYYIMYIYFFISLSAGFVKRTQTWME